MDFIVINKHLTALHDEMEVRFDDLLKLEIPSWVTSPFDTPPDKIEISLQETLIEFQADEFLKKKLVMISTKYGVVLE